jgi:uncharacterized protein YceK
MPAAVPTHSRFRMSTLLVSLVTLAAVLTGCSSTSSSGSAPSSSGAGQAGTKTDSDPNAGVKNGTTLKAALLTAKDVPSGFKVDKDFVRDTADVYGPKAKIVAPSKAACKQLDTNVWVGGSGVGSASFAQTSYKSSFGGELDAEIDGFRGTDSSTVMTNLHKLLKLCPSFKITVPGVGKATMKLSTKAGSKVGDESIKAVLTSATLKGGTTLVAIRVGTSVVSVLYSSPGKDQGAKALKLAETMAERLA